MQKIIDGLNHFQTNVYESHRELFEKLALTQNPETLFITCADSRINPNMITQTLPGELFIVRNAGNIVPPHGAASGGEAATVEYAVAVLGVRDIIVCGHSDCGAMRGLLNLDKLDHLPVVKSWLNHAEATRRILAENYSDLTGEDLLMAAVEENVLVQIENLRTLPSVAAKLAAGAVTLHGWVYDIASGDVRSIRTWGEDGASAVLHRSKQLRRAALAS